MNIRSKCSSTKFFYELGKKKNAICGTIKTLINDGKEITMPNEINLNLKAFMGTYLKKI